MTIQVQRFNLILFFNLGDAIYTLIVVSRFSFFFFNLFNWYSSELEFFICHKHLYYVFLRKWCWNECSVLLELSSSLLAISRLRVFIFILGRWRNFLKKKLQNRVQLSNIKLQTNSYFSNTENIIPPHTTQSWIEILTFL